MRRIASDFSTGMIEQVKKLQKQEYGNRPIWSQVEAKVLDAHVLDGIENASISHITGTMVYNLVANGRQALEAAYRVLQPAGVIGMTLGAGAELMELVRIYIALHISSSSWLSSHSMYFLFYFPYSC